MRAPGGGSGRHTHVGVAWELAHPKVLLAAWTRVRWQTAEGRDTGVVVLEHRFHRHSALYGGVSWQQALPSGQPTRSGVSGLLGLRQRF